MTDRLVWPRDRLPLSEDGASLAERRGHRYPPGAGGIPILLRDDVRVT